MTKIYTTKDKTPEEIAADLAKLRTGDNKGHDLINPHRMGHLTYTDLYFTLFELDRSIVEEDGPPSRLSPSYRPFDPNVLTDIYDPIHVIMETGYNPEGYYKNLTKGAKDGTDTARAVWHMVEVLASAQDPQRVHQAYANTIINKVKESGELGNIEEKTARRALAEALCDEMPAFRKAVGMDCPPPTEEKNVRPWVHDKKLAKYLSRKGNLGRLLAKELLGKSKELLYQEHMGGLISPIYMRPKWDPWFLWENWIKVESERGKNGGQYRHWVTSPAFKALAKVLWIEEVKGRLIEERTATTRGLIVPGYTDKKGDRYAGMGKVTEGLTWALGGVGVRVDADTYTSEPEIAARFMPPAATLEIPEQSSGQRVFPFALEADLPPELQASGLTPTIIRPTAAKLVVLALAAARQTNTLILCTLEELTRYINQGQPYKGRMCKRTAKALRDMDRLKFVFPDDTVARVFSDVRHPRGEPTPDQIVGWAPGRMVQGAIRHGVKDGWFLINLSGIMRMKGNQHIHDLRLYLLAASDWNRLRQAGKAPRGTLEQWSARANMLTPNAAQYLAGDRRNRRSGKVRLHEGRKKTQAAFERLDEAGLIKIEKCGKTWIPSQPKAHREAWKIIRNKGSRDK